MIDVLILAETRVCGEALASVLASDAELRVSASEPCDPALELGCVLQGNPDVALLHLQPEHGARVARELHVRAANLAVVALGVPDLDRDVIAYAEAGVSALLPPTASLPEVNSAIRQAARGEASATPRAVRTLLEVFPRASSVCRAADELSPRELQVLQLIERGLSNKEIAECLVLEVSTVKNHVHRILKKLGAQRRSHAAALLRQRPSDVAQDPPVLALNASGDSARLSASAAA